jgi:hypothetical protein
MSHEFVGKFVGKRRRMCMPGGSASTSPRAIVRHPAVYRLSSAISILEAISQIQGESRQRPPAHDVERSRGRLWRELLRRLGPEPVRIIFPGWSRTQTALLFCSLLARSTFNSSKDGLPNGDGEQRDDLHNLCILPLFRALCGLALLQDQGRLSLCSAYSIRLARTFLSAGVPKY